MSDLEGVAVNQLINAIAEKLAQMRTAKWFADRVAAANPKGWSAINSRLESRWAREAQ